MVFGQPRVTSTKRHENIVGYFPRAVLSRWERIYFSAWKVIWAGWFFYVTYRLVYQGGIG